MDLSVNKSNVVELLETQKRYFASGRTRDIPFRLEQLEILHRATVNNSEEIVWAVEADSYKPELEVYGGELLPVLDELKYARDHLKEWVVPAKIEEFSDPFDPEAEAYVYTEPCGTVLIIAPWNHPVHLLLRPLVSSIAAGNCTVLKPSEYAPETAKAMAKILEQYFDQKYVAVVLGGVDISAALVREPFDHIMFTGSPAVGRVVMQAAAENLVPITLELGGKSPCIVDKEADIDKAAERIIWGKLFNAGQDCVAPDYVLAHRDIKAVLLERMGATLRQFYGDDPQRSKDIARIATDKHFEKLVRLLNAEKVVFGGTYDKQERYIEPTILDNISWDDPVMGEEIFGPILPVIEYQSLDDAIRIINERPKPLALYVFTENRHIQDQIIGRISYGGGCVNDTLVHTMSPLLPFGGVGNSGMGAVHGKAGFDALSHKKSILKRTRTYDSTYRNPPYNEMQLGLIKGLVQ
ncbi:MAG: aldehyde dehydrogenase family protein [Dehalococcoidia bacterium]|nr:aldehyde dehydrogenase family protein [Dehalococcoidia bacterium]